MDDWKELIKDFLDEAYALIENLEESLLNLEKNTADQRAIDTVFRVAHTIKGGAGAVGFDDVQKLTHKMEDVLDMVRTKKIGLSQDDISLLLEVRDELQTLLKAYEYGSPHTFDRAQALIARLEVMKTGGATPLLSAATPSAPVAPSAPAFAIDALPIAARFNLTPELVKLFEDSVHTGEEFVFIEIRFNEEYEMKEVGPLEVLNVLNNFAEPIHMNPDADSIDAEYQNYLNVIIPSEDSIEKIEYKLSLSDVVTSVKATPLSEEFAERLTRSMRGEPETEPAELATEPPAPLPSTPSAPTPPAPATPISAPTPATREIAAKPAESEEKRNPTLRVESGRIDELLNLLGELVIIRSGLGQFEMDMEKAIQHVRLGLRNFLASTSVLPLSEDSEQNSQRNEVLRLGVQGLADNMDNYVDHMQQLSRISGTLQGRMMNLRMVPVQTVFSRFPRLIRDIAKQLGKKIELIIEGEETEIDKGMIDDLYDPLMHMIRNSLDHAIELPADRTASGKGDTGVIRLTASQEGDSIFIEVSDDGKGIDGEKIKRKALEKGFISQEQADGMSEKDAVSLVFAAGFSTADQVSNLSGRGVGMDVVRRKIEELGGGVSISTVLGKGTTVRIRLPLTLAIIQGLLLQVENIHFVIPVAFVEETVILNPKELRTLDNYRALKFRGNLIPVMSLSGVLYGNDVLQHPRYAEGYEEPSGEAEKERRDYCTIIKYGERQVGVVVSSILGEQDIVIKPLDTKLIKSPGLAAATIVGNGELGFILDMPQIIRHYFTANAAKNKEAHHG